LIVGSACAVAVFEPIAAGIGLVICTFPGADLARATPVIDTSRTCVGEKGVGTGVVSVIRTFPAQAGRTLEFYQSAGAALNVGSAWAEADFEPIAAGIGSVVCAFSTQVGRARFGG
jgi:hypothetical protein